MKDLINSIQSNWFDHDLFKILMAIITFGVAIIVKNLFVRSYDRFIVKRAGELDNNPTNFKFLKHSVSAIIYIIGFGLAVNMIPFLKTIAGTLLAGAGILTVAIGFASQHALSNIISGVFIVLFKPFKINDRIQIGLEISGVVEDITLRHTLIRNFENKRVVIPNSVISQDSLVNSNIIEDKICKILDFGISYDSDIKKARSIIQDVAINHPNFLDNRSDEQKEAKEHPIIVRVSGWGESSILIRVWIWAKDSTSAYVLGCDLYEEIKERFDEEGIQIPYPHRTVIIKDKK